MVEQKIEFRKIRDFGENLSDTFLFIKQNFKPLLLSFLAICSIFFLAQAIATGLYMSRILNTFGRFQNRRSGSPGISDIITGEYFFVLLFGWLMYTAMKVALGGYIKYYTENNGAKPGIEDIWRIFRKYYFKVLVYCIPISLLTVIGYLFCVVPGVYLTVALLPFEFALIMEDASFGQAWDRCFVIIKDNFWISLAIYIVSGLIYAVSGQIIRTIIAVITGIGSFFTTTTITPAAGIGSSFLEMFANVFFIVFYVSVALHYFNLVELRDGTGILNRINTLGDNKNNFDNIEEQY